MPEEDEGRDDVVLVVSPGDPPMDDLGLSHGRVRAPQDHGDCAQATTDAITCCSVLEGQADLRS